MTVVALLGLFLHHVRNAPFDENSAALHQSRNVAVELGNGLAVEVLGRKERVPVQLSKRRLPWQTYEINASPVVERDTLLKKKTFISLSCLMES
jgi:hypothetical protein